MALRPRLSPGVLFRGGFFRPRLPYGLAATASISATASTQLGLRGLNRSPRPASTRMIGLISGSSVLRPPARGASPGQLHRYGLAFQGPQAGSKPLASLVTPVPFAFIV